MTVLCEFLLVAASFSVSYRCSALLDCNFWVKANSLRKFFSSAADQSIKVKTCPSQHSSTKPVSVRLNPRGSAGMELSGCMAVEPLKVSKATPREASSLE